MATKVQIKTTYEPARTIEPIYTNGDVSSNYSGTLVATCVEEDVLVVDLRSGKPLCRIEGDGEAVTNLAFSPTAAHLAVCSRSLSLRLFAISVDEEHLTASFEPLRTLKPHTTPVVSSAIDRTGNLLATGGADGSVKVWDIRGGYTTHTFHPHGGVVSALCFFRAQAPETSSSKRSQHSLPVSTSILLASGGEDGKIKILSLDARKTVATCEAHVSVVRVLAFSEQHQSLLSASRDRTMILWNTRNWKQEKVMPALEVLETAGFIPGLKCCYSGGENGNLRIWSTDKGSELTPKQPNRLETDAVVGTIVMHEDSILVTIHRDQSMKFHSYSDLARADQLTKPLPITRTVSANLDEVIDMACVAPNFSMLALATNTESIRLASIDPSPTATYPFGSEVGVLEGHKDIIICIDVDWSGHWLATGAKDNTARLWRLDPTNSSYRCTAIFEGHAESLGAIALPRSAPSVGAAAADPLQYPPALLLTGSQDKTIKRWDMSKIKASADEQTGTRALYTRVAHEKDINALDVSPIAPLFASASQDKTIKVWSLEDGSVTGILRGHKRGVWSVKFSPAGTPPINLSEGGSSSTRGLLVSGSGDRTVKIWSLSTYTCLLTFEGHSNSVLKVIWLLPPSQSSHEPEASSLRQRQSSKPIIASASADTLIKLWSPYTTSSESDPLLTTLDNHTDRVWALVTPPPSSHTGSSSPYPLISGAADATLTFWRDTTTATASTATKRATERIEQDQLLQNHIFSKNYREVITLSLALNHPGRLLRVFQDVISLPNSEREDGSLIGVRAVDDVVASLDETQVFQLLERVRDWNTNARTAPVAQRVLSCLLRSYPASFFVDMSKNRSLGKGGKGVRELLRALEVYTDRHYKRMEDLVDESYLLEYTVREMDEVAGGVGLHGVNGDGVLS
jgi:U3 small nucleolar RNA-associated protein 13